MRRVYETRRCRFCDRLQYVPQEHIEGCLAKLAKVNWMPSVASTNPTLPPIVFARRQHPCGEAWDVPEQSWLLRLRRTPMMETL